MDYYKIALYSTNAQIDVPLNGFISFSDLGAGVPGEPNNSWLEIDVTGLSGVISQDEPDEMVGGHLKQNKAQRLTYSPKTRAIAHPSETALRIAIYDIFNRENIFMANLDYDAPEIIAAPGFAVSVAGVVETEDEYDDGSKVLTLKISNAEVR